MEYKKSIPPSPVVIGSVLAAMVLYWPYTGLAFVHWVCDGSAVVWDSHPDHLRVSAVSFPGGSSFRTALGDVVDQFNTNPSNFRFELDYDERYVRIGGQSEIWFTSDPEEHWGFDAMTWPRMTCREIKSMDIVFNVDSLWTTSTNTALNEKYGGDAVSFQASLMHELGHAMGLYHEGDEYNLMGQSREHLSTNSFHARAYLGEDAADGAVHLYGANSSAGEDVGVVHWKWFERVEFGDYGDYSEHRRTEIYAVTGGFLISWVDGEPNYIFDQGQTLDVEFTFENNGNHRQEFVEVGFYLSNNDLITTRDRRIGGFVADLGRNQVWTTIRRITLPDDLQVSRYYYLGAIVDETDTIDESTEANNATYVARFMVNPVR